MNDAHAAENLRHGDERSNEPANEDDAEDLKSIAQMDPTSYATVYYDCFETLSAAHDYSLDSQKTLGSESMQDSANFGKKELHEVEPTQANRTAMKATQKTEEEASGEGLKTANAEGRLRHEQPEDDENLAAEKNPANLATIDYDFPEMLKTVYHTAFDSSWTFASLTDQDAVNFGNDLHNSIKYHRDLVEQVHKSISDKTLESPNIGNDVLRDTLAGLLTAYCALYKMLVQADEKEADRERQPGLNCNSCEGTDRQNDAPSGPITNNLDEELKAVIQSIHLEYNAALQVWKTKSETFRKALIALLEKYIVLRELLEGNKKPKEATTELNSELSQNQDYVSTLEQTNKDLKERVKQLETQLLQK